MNTQITPTYWHSVGDALQAQVETIALEPIDSFHCDCGWRGRILSEEDTCPECGWSDGLLQVTT